MARSLSASLGAMLCALFTATLAQAQSPGARPSVSESFTIGTTGPSCEAQGVSMGQARRSIFDRKWVILCSDVARPVGTAFAFRDQTDLALRASTQREEDLDCTASARESVDYAGETSVTTCRGRKTGFEWKLYSAKAGRTTYSVEGLAGYDSALRLALANLVTDTIVEGEISIANLGSPDALAIAKAKAAVTNIDTLIGQGYRGNSAGSYAEAAELFAAAPEFLGDASGQEGTSLARQHEVKINNALQRSNLGEFDQAQRLFDQARPMTSGDPVQTRLARNYEAIDAINRGDLEDVLEILDRPVAPFVPSVSTNSAAIRIDSYTAAGLNASDEGGTNAVLGQETRLTPQERTIIIDAQAMQLRGTAMRLMGQPSEAREALSTAYQTAMRVRDGRVTSIARLRSQILSETALSHEAQGNNATAQALLRQALTIVERQYPDSKSVNTAKARLAGFLARRGQDDEALSLFREIAKGVSASRDTLVGMENLMRPYFDLLTAGGEAAPANVGELFLVSQLVERPGAADTMAQLARELEGGDDEASAIFRQSVALGRELERSRIRIARLNAVVQAGGSAEGLADLQQRQDRLLDAQLSVMNTLADYPQFRAVAHRFVPIADMRATLRPQEAYLKLVEVAGHLYAVYLSPQSAMGWRLELSAEELTDNVAILRDSISVAINGSQLTYPLEIDTAIALHKALLGPAAGEVAALRHLIFEPDGALLQLPINLLTGDTAGVDAYHARVDQGGDEFDFTGIEWLGRNKAVSTALSATSFRDARKAPVSDAGQSFLGMGQNLPLGPVSQVPSTTRGAGLGEDGLRTMAAAGCGWPVGVWNRPISAAELREASGLFGQSRSSLMTGAAFTDSAIIERQDLDDYRILHFATHGLVTSPGEGCPARPALLTSFGGPQSDGLLTFKEIFNLRINADLVVLSACDTASQASLEANLEAGITSGGAQALDGLVRAFIAAGGRQVIASHWPAPDDFDATKRLFTSFYKASGASVGDALMGAQRILMDDATTSHPFYWAGFAIIGDAARPVSGR